MDQVTKNQREVWRHKEAQIQNLRKYMSTEIDKNRNIQIDNYRDRKRKRRTEARRERNKMDTLKTLDKLKGISPL